MEKPTGKNETFCELVETLPEQENQGSFGRFVCYLANVTQGGWDIRERLRKASTTSSTGEHLVKIESILQGMTDDGKEALLDALKYQKKNCSEEMNDECYNRLGCTMEDMWEQFAFGQMEKNDKRKVCVLDEVKNYRLHEAIKMKEPLQVV